MRFYTKQHKFYCGIDLHAKTMYLCILDQEGEIKLQRDCKSALKIDPPSASNIDPPQAVIF